MCIVWVIEIFVCGIFVWVCMVVVDDKVGVVMVFVDEIMLDGFVWVSYLYCKV